MPSPTEDVYCTLLMSDSYLPGVAILAHSLRDAGTKKKIAVLVTLDSLLYNTITQLKKIFDYVIPVEKIANPRVENLARMDRLDLRFAFTKINLWKQEQFRKIVYVDADVVALRAPDELFKLDHAFAAAPDIGWPDIFNSGVMMLTPNAGEYRSLSTFAASGVSFDGADQGLFNEYFGNCPWQRLSFTYNCTPSSSYQYEPAYRHFRSNISMVHFIGKQKPWQEGRRSIRSATTGVYRELVGKWWAVYDKHYKAGQTSALGQVSAEDRHLQQFVKDEDSHSAGFMASAPNTGDGGHMSSFSPKKDTQSTNSSDAFEKLAIQTPFAPPQSPWDATRSAPPTASQAEAGGFPSQKYEMSSSRGLFQAPQHYPEPPKDIDYQLPPRVEPTKPPPIFPWEHQAMKPTRVFADSPPPAQFRSNEASQSGPISDKAEGPTVSTPLQSSTTTMSALDSVSRTNAWDGVMSIDQYVRAVQESQSKRAGTQVPQNEQKEKFASDSDFNGAKTPDSQKTRAQRQNSLILTDFPSEFERPSLPVTPAVRRPSFWGEERDEAGELPAAEGVPNQSDWNPHERLEQLRRSSVAAADELPRHETAKEPPLRALPETSSELPPASVESTASANSTQKAASADPKDV